MEEVLPIEERDNAFFGWLRRHKKEAPPEAE
jgi:hypothetical protein